MRRGAAALRFLPETAEGWGASTLGFNLENVIMQMVPCEEFGRQISLCLSVHPRLLCPSLSSVPALSRQQRGGVRRRPTRSYFTSMVRWRIFFFFFFNSLLMFSKSLNKVRCVNSLINNVKMELTACGYLGSTIACQPTLPPYKSCPAVFPLFRAQSANQSFVEAEGQPAPFCGATAAGRPRGGLR